jgi:hypothetical protein
LPEFGEKESLQLRAVAVVWIGQTEVVAFPGSRRRIATPTPPLPIGATVSHRPSLSPGETPSAGQS